jgi:DNA-binding MurR/RpiR family transcriptional regulator
MTISEIAERISISKSTVIAINRRFQVRNYGGMRTRWIQRNAEDAAEQEALLLVKKQSA